MSTHKRSIGGCPHAHAEVFQQDDSVRAVSGVPADGDTIGVLLVCHGSRSGTWRNMLLDVHEQVENDLLSIPCVGQVRTAFMEYAEPSIASQMRAFDEIGIERVIIVPLLLTISNHSFDDIPTICGLSSDPACVADLKKEKVEIYAARALVEITPMLDFSGIVRTNLHRRVCSILDERGDAAEFTPRDGLVLVGYGSEEYDDEWNAFFSNLCEFAESKFLVAHASYSWCGHLVGYKRAPTIAAIDSALGLGGRAIVVPILVAFDEMFQVRIIGGAVAESSDPDSVLYHADSILPDPAVGRWVVEIVRSSVRTVGTR